MLKSTCKNCKRLQEIKSTEKVCNNLLSGIALPVLAGKKITRPGELGLVIFRCLLFYQSKIAGVHHGELILRAIINRSITVASQGYSVSSDITIKTGCTAVTGNGNIRGHCYNRTCKGISCISIDV